MSSSETMAAVDARKQKLREAGKRARQLYLDRSEMVPVVEGRGVPKQKKKRTNKRCVHNKQFYTCATCRADTNLPIMKKYIGKPCEHGKKRSLCSICSPRSYCVHNKRFYRCAICRAEAKLPILKKYIEKPCEQRKKRHHKRCALHNKILTLCRHPECGGGSSLCYKHGAKDGSVRKANCKGCRGSRLCYEHGAKDGSVQKSYCKGCRGSRLCFEHETKNGRVLQKAYCKDCRGSELCFEHGAKEGNVRKSYCKGCCGKNLCYQHGAKDGSVQKARCRECKGSALCFQHGKKDGSMFKRYCRECKGSALCFQHGLKDGSIQKALCRECKGSALCFQHGLKYGSIKKAFCRECYGSQLCFQHGAKDGRVLKIYCKECGGKLLCAGCKLYIVRKEGNYCRFCRTISWQGVRKERVVGDALIKWSEDGVIPLFTTANKPLGRGTTAKLFRVDFMYDLGTYIIAIEVDEEQHMRASYNGNCELVRTYEIALACCVPTTFIRYNPDSLRIGGVLERVPRQLRHALLLEVLKESLALPSTAFLTVIYVFYDQPSKRMFGEAHDYVTTQTFATEVDYEAFVGSAYPSGCAGPAAGTPWYAKQD